MHAATAITLGIVSANAAFAAWLLTLGYDHIAIFMGGAAAVTLMGTYWDRHSD